MGTLPIQQLSRAFAVAGLCLACMSATAQQNTTVLGPSNTDLYYGANALLAGDAEEGVRLANVFAYPLVVRPSYVLGGRAMQVVFNEKELKRYMHEATEVSSESPLLLDHFVDDAIDTIANSVSRMKRLMEQLTRGSKEPAKNKTDPCPGDPCGSG